jgi:outer membrane protein OmpA-like peptidoglycan-associated protein
MTFLLSCFVYPAVGQTKSRVITGTVRSKIDYSLVEDYQIDLLTRENELLETKQIRSKDSKFEFNLDPLKQYTLRVVKDSFDTEIVDVQSDKIADANFYRLTIGNDTTSFLMEGIVLDDEGVALDSVFVRITNVMTHYERWAFTDATGRYQFRLRKGYDYKVKAKKGGYLYDDGTILYCENKLEKNSRYCLQYFDDARYMSKKKDGEEYILTILSIEPIDLQKTYRLDKIYYDLDKWNIRPDAARELNKLVKVLQNNPEINIELGSHTDSRASDEYNDTLSQKRAESAVNYIVAKGIDTKRISAKGYGEQVLVNKCADGVQCSEVLHQRNRRTEFRITSFTKWTVEEQPY